MREEADPSDTGEPRCIFSLGWKSLTERKGEGREKGEPMISIATGFSKSTKGKCLIHYRAKGLRRKGKDLRGKRE